MVQDAFETETLARLYLEQGHPEKAQPIFQRLHRDNPSTASISEGLARCNELLAARSSLSLQNQERRLAILTRLLAMLLGEVPVEPHKPLVSAAPDVVHTALSPRARRLALLQKLLNKLTAREA